MATPSLVLFVQSAIERLLDSERGRQKTRSLFCMQIKSDYFGKYCEHKIFAELLREHFDVFTTIVDNKGIDCVVRINKTTYLDIQIKGRQEYKPWIFNIGEFEPNKNYFFILIPPDKKIYVIPSTVIRSWVDSRWKVNCRDDRKKTMSKKYEYKEYGDFKKLLNYQTISRS